MNSGPTSAGPALKAGRLELDPFTEDVMAAYRGWDTFELSRGGPAIIDFDLSPKVKARQWNSREQILQFFVDATTNVPEGSRDAKFVRAKLLASVTYLRALLGEQQPFKEYIEQTIGVSPQYVPETQIESSAADLDEKLSRYGLSFSRSCREDFYQAFVEKDTENIRREILAAWERYRPMVESLLGRSDAPEALIKFSEVDKYWINWFTATLDEGVVLQINTHPRTAHLRGRSGILAVHELGGHGNHATRWAAAISAGRMSPICGLTTVHGPEQFLFEGVAQVLPYIVGVTDDPQAALVNHTVRHKTLVLSNAHIMINEGTSSSDALDYAAERLPFTLGSVIESEIRDRSLDPLMRCYQFVYQPSEQALLPAITLNSAPQQKLLRGLLDVVLTPDDVKGAVANALSSPSD